MNRTKKILLILCAVSVTALLGVAVPFMTNTFVGGDVGGFFDKTSAIGTFCACVALFLPFISAIFVFTAGLILAKHRQVGMFTASVSVLTAMDVLAPFMLQFVFSGGGASNPVSGFFMLLFMILSLPSNSAAFAFNDSMNRFFPGIPGGRLLVFFATLLSYLLPVLLSLGFLIGSCVRREPAKQEGKKE